jgi:hypothetical protein
MRDVTAMQDTRSALKAPIVSLALFLLVLASSVRAGDDIRGYSGTIEVAETADSTAVQGAPREMSSASFI